jgi:hypothetical protein
VIGGLPPAALQDDPRSSALIALAQILTENASKVPAELEPELRDLVSVATGRAEALKRGSDGTTDFSDAHYQAALSRFHVAVLAFCRGR